MFDKKAQSYALFTLCDFRLADKWNAIVALRGSHEESRGSHEAKRGGFDILSSRTPICIEAHAVQ